MISRGLDLSEIKMVYPLVAIPALDREPLLLRLRREGDHLPALAAARYVRRLQGGRVLAISRATGGQASRFFGSYRELPAVTPSLSRHRPFALMILAIFAIFFLVLAARRS